jgi:hypothetical protein
MCLAGVLLYGPPGTGKTMMAKAVAHHTTAAFIAANGAEFVQKYLGEGVRQRDGGSEGCWSESAGGEKEERAYAWHGQKGKE